MRRHIREINGLAAASNPAGGFGMAWLLQDGVPVSYDRLGALVGETLVLDGYALTYECVVVRDRRGNFVAALQRVLPNPNN